MPDVFFKREGTPTSLGELKPGDKFRVYDDFIEDAFPATYEFVCRVKDDFVCLVVDLDTREEMYVMSHGGVDYPRYEDKKHIVMVTSRQLRRLA